MDTHRAGFPRQLLQAQHDGRGPGPGVGAVFLLHTSSGHWSLVLHVDFTSCQERIGVGGKWLEGQDGES